jgi:hypothetical protein
MLNNTIKNFSDRFYFSHITKSYNERIKSVIKANPELRRYQLQEEQINETKEIWKQFKVKPNINWIKAYSYAYGSFSPFFIADDIYFGYVEPSLNNLFFSKAFSDKNVYDKIFNFVKTPETVIRRIHNRFYNKDYQLLKTDLEILKCLIDIENETYLLKPSIVDGGGKNIELIELGSNLRPKKSSEGILNKLKCYSSDFIIQKLVKQHSDIESIYPHSLNCLRLLTFRFNHDIIVLSAVIKFGSNNSFLDSQKYGGVNCRIQSDGQVATYAFNDRAFTKVNAHPQTKKRFDTLKIPAYAKIKENVQQMHRQLLHQDMASWDMAINDKEEPILIETNLSWQAIALQQANNGPLFGSLSKEVLKSVFDKPKRRVYIRISS